MGDRRPVETTLHATTIVFSHRAALIQGAAGSGKSGLALQLLALGAALVADDRTRLWRKGAQLMADAPGAIRGQIEARGVGILHAPPAGPAPVALVVDMDDVEEDRLPPEHQTQVLGVTLPLIKKTEMSHFPAAILLYLEHGRIA